MDRRNWSDYLFNVLSVCLDLQREVGPEGQEPDERANELVDKAMCAIGEAADHLLLQSEEAEKRIVTPPDS